MKLKQYLQKSDYKDLARALERGDYLPDWVIEWAQSYYADCVPYGTLTGDTGTMDEYIGERIEDVTEYFELELKEAGWSGEIAG